MKSFCHGILDDIIHKLLQAKMFTIADFFRGYWHMEFDKTSYFSTTFYMSFGRFKSAKIPFDLTLAYDAFQYKLDTIFGTKNLALA